MKKNVLSIKKIKDIIKDLKPIEGENKIEFALVDGLQYIVEKGEFKVGDRIWICQVKYKIILPYSKK